MARNSPMKKLLVYSCCRLLLWLDAENERCDRFQGRHAHRRNWRAANQEKHPGGRRRQDHSRWKGWARSYYPKNARLIDLEGRTIHAWADHRARTTWVLSPARKTARTFTREKILRTRSCNTSNTASRRFLSLGLNRDLIYELREQQRQGTFPGASIFTAGRGFGAESGAPRDSSGAPIKSTGRNLRKKPGSRCSKLPRIIPTSSNCGSTICTAKSPKMDPAIYKAVIDESHKQDCA